MRPLLSTLASTVLVLLVVPPLLAAPASSRTQILQTPSTRSSVTSTDAPAPEVLWSDYAITPDEWLRYRAIMSRAPTPWANTLDPLEVLGREARTAEERTEIAERWVELRHARLLKAQAFGAEFRRLWNARYGDAAFARVLEGLAQIERPYPASPTGAGEGSARSRLLLYIDATCQPCEPALDRALGHLKRGAIEGLDLYLLSATAEDDARAWAAAKGLPPELVASGRLTLNLDPGAVDRLGATPDRLPLALVRDRAGELAWAPAGFP